MDKDPVYNTKASVLEDFGLIEGLLVQRAIPYVSFLYEKRTEKGSGTSKWDSHKPLSTQHSYLEEGHFQKRIGAG